MKAVMLVGLPDSGKTNFLARMWIAMTQQNGAVTPRGEPQDIAYVESLVKHLLQGQFAPRSSSDEVPRPFSVDLKHPVTGRVATLVIPDVRGELWKQAVLTNELDAEWMERLQQCSSVLLFLRVQSDQIVKPLDWVTAQRHMEHLDYEPDDANQLPTQVMMCELLRYLELTLARQGAKPPRVAVLISAWDRLGRHEQEQGPEAYIRDQFPLLAGRIRDIEALELRTFGISILGGDLSDDAEFARKYRDSDSPHSHGYVVTTTESGELSHDTDITLPLAWVLRDW